MRGGELEAPHEPVLVAHVLADDERRELVDRRGQPGSAEGLAESDDPFLGLARTIVQS